MRVAFCGGFGDGRATRVGEAEDFGDFVEPLADGVVAGGADDFEVIMALHVDDLGVATGDDGGEKRKFWLMAAEPVSVDVGFEVVSRIEGDIVDDGNSAGGESADKERADEAGGVSDGDGVKVFYGQVGVGESLVDDGEDGFDMATGGNFGNDATVGGMDVDLRDDNIREDGLAILNNGGGSFVAGGFDTQNFH